MLLTDDLDFGLNPQLIFPVGQNIMEILQSQLQEGVEKLQGYQKQHQKVLSSRQLLDSQLNENKLVSLFLIGFHDASFVTRSVW
jgi:chaperonin cofactor prefoldin